MEDNAKPRDQDSKDFIFRLCDKLSAITRKFERDDREIEKTDDVAAFIGARGTLEDVMNCVYDDFRDIIPYERMCISMIQDEGRTLKAIWVRADNIDVKLGTGFTRPLAGSSLEKICQTREVRVINDLEGYLRGHPNSESTKLMVTEGIRSSLTCPLCFDEKPLGFLF